VTRTHEQLAAAEQLRAAVAPLGPVRVVPDAEGWPVVPGRLGAIEWHDGQALAVFTSRRRLHGPLLAIPGVHRHQRGDDELRCLFLPDPETLAAVARIIRPRRRRVVAPEAIERIRRSAADAAHRATCGAVDVPPALAEGDSRTLHAAALSGDDHA